MMEIKEFAAKHNLSLQINNHIDGAHGFIYKFNSERFAVAIQINWRQAKEAFRAHGFTLDQNNEFNGVALFDPNDLLQVEIVLKLAVCQHALPLNNMPDSLDNTQSAKEIALMTQAIKE